MAELLQFPMISQKDGDVNAAYDCVPSSVAACMEWLTGQKYSGGEIKDAVYGKGYVGGTAAIAYVDYCKARGVTLAPVNGNGSALVAALHQSIVNQHPALITEPSPYGAGWSHVCAAYKESTGQVTVMDPWIDGPVTKSDAEWAAQLEFNQIWTLMREQTATIPQNWHDDGTTLTAPNGVHVVLGFREHILNSTSWDAGNVPQEAEYHTAQVLLHNPAIGAGQRQCFRDGMLWYTTEKGVVWEPFLGLELDAAYQQIATLQAQLPPAVQPVPAQSAVNVSQAISDVEALVNTLPAMFTKILADLGKQ